MPDYPPGWGPFRWRQLLDLSPAEMLVLLFVAVVVLTDFFRCWA